MITALPWQIELWRMRHRFCNDTPEPMEFDEARFVLGEHAGHGSRCFQSLAAQRSVPAVQP